MATRNCLGPQICLMEKENGKSSRLKLQNRRHPYCHVDALFIWCSSSHSLKVSVHPRPSQCVCIWLWKSKAKKSICILCALYLCLDSASPGLCPVFHQPPAFTSQHPWALRKQIWHGHPESYNVLGTTLLDLASKLPSSAEGFPGFPK